MELLCWTRGELVFGAVESAPLAEDQAPSPYWPERFQLRDTWLVVEGGRWMCSTLDGELAADVYSLRAACVDGPLAPLALRGTWNLRSDALELEATGEGVAVDPPRVPGIPGAGPWLAEHLRPSGRLANLALRWRSRDDHVAIEAGLGGLSVVPSWLPWPVRIEQARLELDGHALKVHELRGRCKGGVLTGTLEADVARDIVDFRFDATGFLLAYRGLKGRVDFRCALRYEDETGLRGPLSAQARNENAVEARGLGVVFLGLSTLKTLADALNRAAFAAAFSWVQSLDCELDLDREGYAVRSAVLRGEVLALRAAGRIEDDGRLDLVLTRVGSEGAREAGSLLTAIARGLSDVTASERFALRVGGTLERPLAVPKVLP